MQTLNGFVRLWFPRRGRCSVRREINQRVNRRKAEGIVWNWMVLGAPTSVVIGRVFNLFFNRWLGPLFVSNPLFVLCSEFVRPAPANFNYDI